MIDRDQQMDLNLIMYFIFISLLVYIRNKIKIEKFHLKQLVFYSGMSQLEKISI